MINPHRRAVLAWLLLLLTALPWGTVVGGQADASDAYQAPKLVVSLLGIALAFTARERKRSLSLPAGLLLLYAAVSALGGYAAGPDTTASIERAARYGLIALGATWIIGRIGTIGAAKGLAYFAAVESTLAVIGRYSGQQQAFDGRLAGWLPELHPNSLASVAVLGLTATVTLAVRGDITVRRAVTLGLPMAFVSFATESRTCIAALCVALIVATATNLTRGIWLGWSLAMGATILAIYDSVTQSATVHSIITRDGTATPDGTFTGRTNAWTVAWHGAQSATQMLLGQGLNVKAVHVTDQYSPMQTVDGTIPAAYLQAGAVGVGLLVTAALVTLLRCERWARPLVVATLTIAVLESELNDVTFGLLVLLAAAVTVRGRKGDGSHETSDLQRDSGASQNLAPSLTRV